MNSNEPNWTILHNKLLQLRELDLLGRDCFGSHRLPLQQAHHPALILLSRRSFSVCVVAGSLIPAAASPSRTGGPDRGYSRMRWTDKYSGSWRMFRSRSESPSSRLHPKNFEDWPIGKSYQLQQRNCSDSHGMFLRRPLFQARKELDGEVAACVCAQHFFRSYPAGVATNRRPSPLIEPSAASILPVSAKA